MMMKGINFNSNATEQKENCDADLYKKEWARILRQVS